MTGKFSTRDILQKQNFSDEELIALHCENNDPNALEILFERYLHLLFLVSLKYLKDEDDSKDAVMEVFEKVIDELKVGKIRNFHDWLYTVTKNHCLMIIRKQKRNITVDIEAIEDKMNFMEFAQSNDLPDSEARAQAIERAMQTLNAGQRRCLQLFYFENKSYKEIADLTGFSIKQVKSHIQNGKRNVKNNLESGTSANYG
jgi:RNA polymerase sigma factor (sigma-70 family)